MLNQAEEKSSVRKVRTVGQVLAVLLVLGLLYLTYHTVNNEDANGWMLWAALLGSAAAYPLFMLRRPKGILAWILGIVTALGVPFAAVLLLQNYTLNPIGEKGIYPMMLAANCLFAYLFYLLLCAVIGSVRWGYMLASLLFMLVGIANYFVVQFRGSPIVPWDLLSLRTAASVAGGYTYDTSWRFLWTSFGFVLLIGLGWKIAWKRARGRIALTLRVVLAVLALTGLLTAGMQIQKKPVKDWLGMDQTLFTPNVRYRNNGFIAAFVGNLYLINVEKPEGYSVSKVEEIADEQPSAQEAGFALDQAPNIIVIMDEAFSDLAVLGEFGVSEDYMPNFRKLQKDYVGGYMMTSVKGGNTANTEYEFLSGDTMAFLPAGSVVYQQFIHDQVPTMASQLASLGYTTTAIHPYLPTGWNRDTVYPQLGFQKFLSRYDFVNPKMVREYISDEAAFDKIIEEFEDKADGEKKFIFEVTMQNHSGYSKEYPGFSESVYLTDLSYKNIQTRAAEKYLTLIQESDRALGKLMDYFEKVEEPTIIVMFGDHEPTDYITNVIARITGYDPEDSLEEQQKSYQVPYFVWNNFGMEMEDQALISANFLGVNVLKAAKIPLTAYQNFLVTLQESFPVVCANAYIDTEGTYHSYEESDNDAKKLLNNYNILAYNHLNDTENRIEEVFSLQ